MKKYRKYPPMLQKPYESLYVISNMPIHIREDDYFVGDMATRAGAPTA